MSRFSTWLSAAAMVAVLATACTSAPYLGRVAPDRSCTIERLAWMPSVPLTMLDALRSPPLSDEEARLAGECVEASRHANLARSDHPVAREHAAWQPMTVQAYRSEHGSRGLNVNIFVDRLAAGYIKFEDGDPMPVGARIAKASFAVTHDGLVSGGPLFAMEKMPPGFDPGGGDWRYTLIGPDGTLIGETGGRNAEEVRFCFTCHEAARGQDFLLFPAPLYRRKGS